MGEYTKTDEVQTPVSTYFLELGLMYITGNLYWN
jgi:hypothetical protein